MRVLINWTTFVVLTLILGVTVTVMMVPEPKPVTVEPIAPPPILEEPPIVEPVVEEIFYSERDIECLALNSYYESRNQSVAGQIAVAQVVLNRVESPNFPDTICEVIQQGPTYTNWKGNEMPVRDRCHFSWWCDGKSDIPVDVQTYHRILDRVQELLYSDTVDITDGSLYYHADYVEPFWSSYYERTMVIDDHIFYR